MGISIGLMIIAAACYAYLEIMHKLKKDVLAEKWILGSICAICVIMTVIINLPKKPVPEETGPNPKYYIDGDEVYPNPNYEKPAGYVIDDQGGSEWKSLIKPPAHNDELTEAIYSAVAEMGITRDEVNVTPLVQIDTKVEDISSSLLKVTFSFGTKEEMKEMQDKIEEISQLIIDKYEPQSISFSFDAENGEVSGKNMLLLKKTDDDELYWNLGCMKEGIYKIVKMYKTQ